MNGLVLIDKPAGCTSHDVVNRWRRLAQTKRTGHLGTLDPMATGLLVLLTGNATRLAQYFAQEDKTYQAEITLGKISDSYDADGEIQTVSVESWPSPEQVREALETFVGKILQTPPPVSAKKINGTRAYTLARNNLTFELAPVEVYIKKLCVHRVQGAIVDISVTSSSGTYIRSIAHDLGQKLGCGAILSKLRRTRIGIYGVENAWDLDSLRQKAESGTLESVILPPLKLLSHMPAEFVDDSVQLQIRQGRDFRTSPFVVPPDAPLVRAFNRNGDLIAVGEFRMPNIYHPRTVL